MLETHKEIGSVTEVFRLSHKGKAESLMQQYAGRAAIGHERPLVGAVHGAALVKPGKPGHDMYPEGGPNTIGGVHWQRVLCGSAGTTAADARR